MDDKTDTGGSTVEERNKLKTSTTIIAGVTTLMVGLQGKLQWGKKAEKYQNIAAVYQSIASESYLRMSKVKFCVNAVENAEKDQETSLLEFLVDSERQEKSVFSGADVIPNFVKVRAVAAYDREFNG